MKILTLYRKMFTVLIITSLLLQGCSESPRPEAITRSGFFFDTLISITIYDTDDENLLNRCFEMCRDYEDLLSMTVSGSDIARINEAGNEAVSVSSDTIMLLKAAKEYYLLSDGMLDVTIAPLSKLWTTSRKSGIPPSEEDIRTLLSHVNMDKVIIDTDRSAIIKEDPGIMLDTGALAKGFIADRLRGFLIENGVHSAIISLGGNIITLGSKPDGSPFRIGIQRPFGKASESAASLRVSDMSVVTSGVYERCFTYNDRLYHHILDPKTGWPKDSDLYSATIISSSSLDGDALSTICLLYGLNEAEELINNTPGVEAVFITRDNRLHFTEGARTYVE